jgi:hypothetical protein
MEETAFDPNNRRLCPDGACVGLIGPDGTCTVCGRTAAAAAAGEDAPERESPESAEGPTSTGGLSAESGGFDPNRRLCDDGSCVGLIGPDGTCTVCGQRAGG